VLASAPRVHMKISPPSSASPLPLNLSGCDRPDASAVPLVSGRVPPILLFNEQAPPQRRRGDRDPSGEEPISLLAASSAQLDEMTAARLRTYHLIIVPGGDFIASDRSQEETAASSTSRAVRCEYLGICAGAFFAGHTPYNGLNLTLWRAVRLLPLRRCGEPQRLGVPVSGAGTPTASTSWEDGPQLSGWGAVVGYGTPMAPRRGARAVRKG